MNIKVMCKNCGNIEEFYLDQSYYKKKFLEWSCEECDQKNVTEISEYNHSEFCSITNYKPKYFE
jgi:RNase P subunit RPR2